jgi:hypothetical protein
MEQITMAAAIVSFSQLAKPIVEAGLRLIDTLFGETATVAGGMIADRFYAYRIEQAVTIAAHCDTLLRERGIVASQLPLSFLTPFFESASVEGDPELQALWARLLAAAVAEDLNRHPALRDALRLMSVRESRILRAFAEPYLTRTKEVVPVDGVIDWVHVAHDAPGTIDISISVGR